jgi:flagellar hook-associated protein 2
MAIDYLSALNTKGSGLNITQIVDSLVEADVAPKKDSLNKQITEKNTQISALAEVVSDLSSLKADISALANTTQLAPTSANSGLSIQVTDSAIAKTFTSDVKVEALATSQTLHFSNSNFDSPTAEVGSGTLKLNLGTWSSNGTSFDSSTNATTEQTFNVPDGTTLTGLANLLDGLTGVTASVLNVGGSSADLYAIVVKSELGESNALNIEIASPGAVSGTKTSLASLDTNPGGSYGVNGVGAAGESNAVHKVAAVDAHLKIDGVSVKRNTNTIDDIFDGYTLTANSTPVDSSDNAVSFRVQSSLDVDNAYRALDTLVDSINITKKLFSDLTDRELDGALADDPVVSSIERQLDKFFSGGVPGFFSTNVYMSELGVSTNRDGSISLSETKFRTAMDVEPSSTVAGGSRLFNAVFNSSVYSDNSLLKIEKSSYVEPKAGVYVYAQSGSPPAATIDGSATGISTYSAGTAEFFTSTQTNTAGLKITPSSTAAISGAKIFVGTSILDQLSTYINSVTASSGDLSTRESTLGTQLSDYEIELADIEAKTEGIRDRYMSQFSAMESAVTSLKGTGDYLTNMIDSWNSDN